MLDSDLAFLYKCKNGTKVINQAVKNNSDKFPERFSWRLTDNELNDLRSKKLTTNYSNMSRSNPRVFTEQFSWKLTDNESKSLLVKIFDQKREIDRIGGKYNNPRVFTEQ